MGSLLAVCELRCSSPFFDLRLLAANPVLSGVFLQFGATTFVFYTFFVGLPIWLEEIRGFDARTAGLLILPVTGLGVLVTPLGAALVSRRGTRSSLIIGSVFMLIGSSLLLTFGPAKPVPVLVAVAALLEVPSS